MELRGGPNFKNKIEFLNPIFLSFLSFGLVIEKMFKR